MRILIADDEPIIRLGLKSMIEELGHQVIAASNGREALQQAQFQAVDMAILDIRMPYTDGLQAAATLSRKQPMPILLLTAYSDRELVDRATDLPIHGYLVKPIEPGELAAAISVAIKRYQETKALKQEASVLKQRLETRKLVDRAKGKLMAAGMDEEEAYRAIQRQARASRQSMHQVAQALLRESD